MAFIGKELLNKVSMPFGQAATPAPSPAPSAAHSPEGQMIAQLKAQMGGNMQPGIGNAIAGNLLAPMQPFRPQMPSQTPQQLLEMLTGGNGWGAFAQFPSVRGK